MNSVITQDILSLEGKIKKIVISDRKNKDFEYSKITVRFFTSKKGDFWQLEKQKGAQVFHENMKTDVFFDFIKTIVLANFKQVCITAEGTTVHYNIISCEKIKRKVTGNEITVKAQGHNKQKNYLIPSGSKIPALVDLGVFTEDYKIINSKYDKFKQINRFIEIIDDAFSSMQQKDITILDFGCGKSYLTFIIYYYFTEIKKVNAKIIGFDLKEDVVKNCNEIAKKYGYNNLQFFVNDVTKGEVYKEKVDMVITLHACDIATDFALYHAITHDVKYIFSVPCCQHEICSNIKKGGDFDILLSHGLIKERFSALLTDSIRAEILKLSGYEVDIIEFVDFAHSPKNLMLRCKLKKGKKPDLTAVKELSGKYGFTQKLCELLDK